MTPRLSDSSKNVGDFLVALMNIDSTTGNEAELCGALEAFLKETGWRTTCGTVFKEDRPAYLLATRSETTSQSPRVLFNTHMDTVPPFIPPSVHNDAIHGRGANDAKGQIASMIFALNKLAKNRPELADRVGLLLTSGEETDHIGMIQATDLALNPKFLVVGEPTELRFAVGQKGAVTLRLTCSGKAAHSGYPQEGESAVNKLLDLLQQIRQVEWPKDSPLGETMVNIGIIEGGQAVNALAESAHADIKIRVTKSADEVLHTIEKLVDGQGHVEVFEKNDPVQLSAPPGNYETCVVAFNTDIPFVKNRDFSKGTFLFGPGSILNAHSKDEQVRIEDLEQAVEILVDLVEKLLSTDSN